MNVSVNAAIVSAKIVNAKDLEQQLATAFKQWLEEDVNDEYMSEQFQTSKWAYPPPSTERKNGTIAVNPRDIFDTGELFRSGQESFSISQNSSSIEGKWHWNATNSSGEEYAWFVHEGQGPHSRAPRPWTDEISYGYLFETSDVKRDLEIRVTRAFNA